MNNQDKRFYGSDYEQDFYKITRKNTQELDDFEQISPSPDQLVVCNVSGKYQPGPLYTSFLTTYPTMSQILDVLFSGLSVNQALKWNGIKWINYTPTSGTVTSISTGTGLTGGPITNAGTISLANTAVTAGTYTLSNTTVDAQG